MNKLSRTAFVALLLSGCSLAPDFTKPEVSVPQTFKESATADTNAAWWKKAASLEAVDRGSWWKLFDDKKLNELEAAAAEGNQPLKAYAARVEQARATVKVNAPDLVPNWNIGANGARALQPSVSPKPYTLYTTQATISYEPDLFSRVRDADKALAFEAEGADAGYHSLILSVQADVAQDYFLIRALDDERRLLRDTVSIRQKQADMLKKRYAQGDVSEQDNAQAAADYAQAQADLTGLDRQRANLEHALAILLGKTPAEFSLAESPLTGVPLSIPGGVPSTVLERRPDIAAAITGMEAANKRIGAAKAAYFPDLLLTGAVGTQSASLGNLFQWSARSWAVGQTAGLALTLPIFNNGRISAQVEGARAAYDESVATYRQQVLVAFKEVEDALADQHYLYKQSEQVEEAAAQASRATALTQKRYDLGDIDYTEVVNTQRISLAAERAAVEVRGQRFVATVSLIRALGGGWDDAAK